MKTLTTSDGMTLGELALAWLRAHGLPPMLRDSY